MYNKYTTNNGSGLVITNEGELLDVTFLLPNTDKSEDYIPKMQAINEEYEADETENSKRIMGITKWALLHAHKGSRNETLYRLGAFIRDIGENPRPHIDRVNNMISEPLNEREINTICRSLKV